MTLALPGSIAHSLYNEPFWNGANYSQTQSRELASKALMPVSYSWESGSKSWRIMKNLLIFLSGIGALYQGIHWLFGLIFMPAVFRSNTTATTYRTEAGRNNQWKRKRFTIEVDGYKIDAMIQGKTSTLKNRRWMLFAPGNYGLYEGYLSSRTMNAILDQTNSNALVFNYSSVGASEGIFPSKESSIKAIRALLAFLEDEQRGIGAKEIIGWGFSIGGGYLGEALKNHTFRRETKALMVFDRTFYNMSRTVSSLTFRILGGLTKLLGWQINTHEGIKNPSCQKIILQKVNHVSFFSWLMASYVNLTKNTNSQIGNDGIIRESASLYQGLKEENDQETMRSIKSFGILEDHNEDLRNPGMIADSINSSLRPSFFSRFFFQLSNLW